MEYCADIQTVYELLTETVLTLLMKIKLSEIVPLHLASNKMVISSKN
jgi:hypothetical protein